MGYPSSHKINTKYIINIKKRKKINENFQNIKQQLISLTLHDTLLVLLNV